jgi:hypothetical protein
VVVVDVGFSYTQADNTVVVATDSSEFLMLFRFHGLKVLKSTTVKNIVYCTFQIHSLISPDNPVASPGVPQSSAKRPLTSSTRSFSPFTSGRSSSPNTLTFTRPSSPLRNYDGRVLPFPRKPLGTLRITLMRSLEMGTINVLSKLRYVMENKGVDTKTDPLFFSSISFSWCFAGRRHSWKR